MEQVNTINIGDITYRMERKAPDNLPVVLHLEIGVCTGHQSRVWFESSEEIDDLVDFLIDCKDQFTPTWLESGLAEVSEEKASSSQSG